MSLTLTLVADPARSILEPSAMEAVSRDLNTRVEWLADDEACAFTGDFTPERATSIATEIENAIALDFAILPGQRRRKNILIADMDSTIITVECIDELAGYLNIKSEIAAITRLAMDGELDFQEALKKRVAMLEGLSLDVIAEICRERIRLSPGARALVQTMRAHGAATALVSGGFTEFTSFVASLAGFEHHTGNQLESREGKLTGNVIPPIQGSQAKLSYLRSMAVGRQTDTSNAMAIGDGANDLDMIKAAGIGLAYRAHNVLRRSADARIDQTSLISALFFQGYGRRDFAEQ